MSVYVYWARYIESAIGSPAALALVVTLVRPTLGENSPRFSDQFYRCRETKKTEERAEVQNTGQNAVESSARISRRRVQRPDSPTREFTLPLSRDRGLYHSAEAAQCSR